jgi:hypothetical protein
MTLRLGGDGVITGCTSLGEPTINISGLTVITPIEAISGTAAAPSYTFSGDTDNGLYYAGTNSIGVSTAGTAALTIDSSQQVGIGTTSPSKKLEISASSAEAGIALSSSGRTLVMTSHEQGGVSQATKIGTTSNHELRIITNDTERMRISSTGNVGIGESDPDHLLVLKSTGDARLHIQADSDNIGEDDNPRISFSQDGSDEFWKFEIGLEGTNGQTFSGSLSNCPIFSASLGNVNQPFIFGHNGQAVMAIKNNSLTVSEPRVGIGTMAPAGALDISPSSGRFIVNDSGLCGIGTASPGTLLELSSATPILRFSDTDTTGYHQIQSSNANFIISADPSNATANSSISFNVDGSERMRIDSSGRLLVGTSSESGNARQVIRGNSGSATGAGVIDVGLGTTRPGGANTPLGYIRFTSTSNTSSSYHYAAIHAETDGTSSSNTDIPGRLVFSTTADGASSPTEHVRINSAGTTTVWGTSAPMLWGRNETSGSIVGLAYYNTATSTTSLTGQVFRVMCDGDVENANNRYGAISDIELKENIVDARSQWNDLKALQIRNYNFKAETGYSTHTQIGLVAQETELISPGLVGECIDEETGTSTKTVSYSVLYMKAVKALQEAMERIETLEIEVAALKNK